MRCLTRPAFALYSKPKILLGLPYIALRCCTAAAAAGFQADTSVCCNSVATPPFNVDLLPIQQEQLLERNALLEQAYAMTMFSSNSKDNSSGGGGGGGEAEQQRNGFRSVAGEASAWWLTEKMQVGTHRSRGGLLPFNRKRIVSVCMLGPVRF